MIRSGRSRSAARTRSASVTGGGPSASAGRASKRTAPPRPKANSRVSSMTRTRSPAAVSDNNADSSDVLPDEVAPETNDVAARRQDLVEQRLAVGTGEFVDRPHVGGEASDRQHGAVDGDRRQDRTDPRPVGEASVDDRCGAVDAPADRRQYPFEEMLDPLAVEVTGRGDRAAAVDPDLTAGVDEDLVDRRVAEQDVEVAEPARAGRRPVRASRC